MIISAKIMKHLMQIPIELFLFQITHKYQKKYDVDRYIIRND